jgi:hypothetical protein
LVSRTGRAGRAADDDATRDDDDEPSDGNGRVGAVARATSAGRRRRDDAGTGGGSSVPPSRGLLNDDELRVIEDGYADGITAVQIVEVFTSRGVKFSEASFRKYVQQGLLPRSRRVGRKGKHRGSLGVYPAKTVRRINAVKQLMLDGYTIEEIQGQFLQYTDLVEGLAEGLSQMFHRLEHDVASPRVDAADRRVLTKDAAEARRAGDELMRRLEELVRRVAAPRTDRIRRSGAAGSAEDLL